MIYLDNAASSHPKPLEVLRAVSRQLRENGANPGRSGHKMSAEASKTIYRTRTLLAEEFGTEAETVLFTQNTTDAINRALKGILRAGDHVIISDLEHNSVLRPLVAMRERGVEFDVAETSDDDEETANNFQQKTKPNTRLIFCTHASNVTGQILPIRAIGELCRRQGILFGVDAAQTAGTEQYDLRKDPIDLLCIPGHKGLLGPQGTGALILASPLDLAPLTEGGTGSDSLLETQPNIFPEGYESGTLNTPGIAGLGEGVRFIRRYRDAIRRHERALRKLFLRETETIPQFSVLYPKGDAVGTVALNHRTAHSEDVCRYLDWKGICTRGGYHCSALAHKKLGTETQGALRISFGYRNTEDEVLECIRFLKNYQTNCIRT